LSRPAVRACDPTPWLEGGELLLTTVGEQLELSVELSRRRAVSATELRIAGDLFEDLEHDRLEDRERCATGWIVFASGRAATPTRAWSCGWR
jgi:hypothetical protein